LVVANGLNRSRVFADAVLVSGVASVLFDDTRTLLKVAVHTISLVLIRASDTVCFGLETMKFPTLSHSPDLLC
jgi:hypothetical protein